MSELDRMKGLDVGDTYINNHAAANFVTNREVLSELSGTKFYSLTMDGTTDVSTSEQECVYVRAAKNGKIQSNFLKMVEPENTTGEVLSKVILDAVGVMDDKTNATLVGITSDGASNMLGRQKGAVSIVKSQHPHILTNHCLVHRLELAYKDALKKEIKKGYDKVLTALVGVYYFYKKSSLQRKQLRHCFIALGMKPQVPSRIGGTQWMAHMIRSINKTLASFQGLTTHLATASHSNAKAEGLYKLLTSTGSLAFIVFLRVIWFFKVPYPEFISMA